MVKQVEVNAIGGQVPTNGALLDIVEGSPYVATFTLKGVCDLLFHRWNVEGVKSKGESAKGSKAKKTDDVESYVWRNDVNELCIPGEYVRQSIIHAARFRQDPRSPRKSAMDLFKAGIISLTDLASLGETDWSHIDKRRVTIMRSAITRFRPAIKAGWKAEFQIMVQLAEYISPDVLHEVLVSAGKLIGLADFRPSYGRFSVVKFETGLA